MEREVDLGRIAEPAAVERPGNQEEAQRETSGEGPEAVETVKAPEEDAVQKLASALEQARAEAAEKHDMYLRKAAEFENFRRRRDRDLEETVRSANEGLISRLLPVLENFERAQGHRDPGENAEAYRKGMELIIQQFKDVFRREGVEALESVGQPFDPNLHDALMQAPSAAYEAGLVCEEVERGYRLKDRVVRHAKVIVSLGTPEKKGEA